jgi:hypothetical protein
MPTSALIVALTLGSLGAGIPGQDVKENNEIFERHWGTEFVWKFDELPTQGTLPNFRVPYSGYIYPDTAGGTANALSKYDRAFNGGRSLAVAYEKYDTTAYKRPIKKPLGPFGLITPRVMGTPDWHGHCNGWAAAAIRHAEPQNAVRTNGVVFAPADIKALLAEIYLYNEPEPLAGWDYDINAGLLHAIVANWIGRGSHPIGVEADPGEEKWNYPLYAFSSSSAKRSSRTVEVKMNIAYAKDSNGEYQESPRIRRTKYFHYMLQLDTSGRIVGGSYYRDSDRIDMLWVPVAPRQGGLAGNERGNRHVDVNKVLALWRASVPEETRTKWPVIDPSPEDRLLVVNKVEDTIIPQGFSIVIKPETPENAEEEITSEDAGETTAPEVAAATANVNDNEETDDEAASTY